jgi:hypothetical protein
MADTVNILDSSINNGLYWEWHFPSIAEVGPFEYNGAMYGVFHRQAVGISGVEVWENSNGGAFTTWAQQDSTDRPVQANSNFNEFFGAGYDPNTNKIFTLCGKNITDIFENEADAFPPYVSGVDPFRSNPLSDRVLLGFSVFDIPSKQWTHFSDITCYYGTSRTFGAAVPARLQNRVGGASHGVGILSTDSNVVLVYPGIRSWSIDGGVTVWNNAKLMFAVKSYTGTSVVAETTLLEGSNDEDIFLLALHSDRANNRVLAVCAKQHVVNSATYNWTLHLLDIRSSGIFASRDITSIVTTGWVFNDPAESKYRKFENVFGNFELITPAYTSLRTIFGQGVSYSENGNFVLFPLRGPRAEVYTLTIPADITGTITQTAATSTLEVQVSPEVTIQDSGLWMVAKVVNGFRRIYYQKMNYGTPLGSYTIAYTEYNGGWLTPVNAHVYSDDGHIRGISVGFRAGNAVAGFRYSSLYEIEYWTSDGGTPPTIVPLSRAVADTLLMSDGVAVTLSSNNLFEVNECINTVEVAADCTVWISGDETPPAVTEYNGG